MNEKSKFKNLGTIAIANILGAIISAVFWLYLANLMGEKNYGELGFLIGIGSISMSIAIWGSDKAITVFTAKSVNIQPPIYLISFVTSGLTALFLFILLDSIGLSIFVIGAVIYNLTIAEIIGRKQYKKYAKIVLSQKLILYQLYIQDIMYYQHQLMKVM